jgi:formate hydrogenlyase subunit 6/NADH:ubiquinone oxidoreductase subunit I
MAIDVRPAEPMTSTPPGPPPSDRGRWVEIDGQRFRRRNPAGAYLLALATVGLYAVVWLYRVNDDARRYLRDGTITPALSALGFMTGMAAPVPLVVLIVLALLGRDVGLVAWILAIVALLVIPVPLVVAVYRTGERIRRVQERAGVEPTASGAAGALLAVPLLHIPLYQSELNDVFGKAPPLPAVGLVKGLLVTLRHLLSRSITQQYPHEKPDLPPRTRGVIALKPENCTVCWKCSRECPDWCIYIESHKETHEPASGGRARSVKLLDRFAIDYALCMYCGICVEVCPFDALFWSPEFEYATYSIAELTHEKDRLDEWTYTVLPPPELEDGAEPVEEAPAPAPHSEAPTSAAPAARPGAAEPPAPAAPGPPAPGEAAVAPAEEQAQKPPGAPEGPAPAAAMPESPATGEAQPPPHEMQAEVEPDQGTYDRILQEELAKGTDRRVAEGRAKAAAIRAARAKAPEGRE